MRRYCKAKQNLGSERNEVLPNMLAVTKPSSGQDVSDGATRLAKDGANGRMECELSESGCGGRGLPTTKDTYGYVEVMWRMCKAGVGCDSGIWFGNCSNELQGSIRKPLAANVFVPRLSIMYGLRTTEYIAVRKALAANEQATL
jgi:hypothetical protein